MRAVVIAIFCLAVVQAQRPFGEMKKCHGQFNLLYLVFNSRNYELTLKTCLLEFSNDNQIFFEKEFN